MTLLRQGGGLDDPQRSLPNPTIPSFCDSVNFCATTADPGKTGIYFSILNLLKLRLEILYLKPPLIFMQNYCPRQEFLLGFGAFFLCFFSFFFFFFRRFWKEVPMSPVVSTELLLRNGYTTSIKDLNHNSCSTYPGNGKENLRFKTYICFASYLNWGLDLNFVLRKEYFLFLYHVRRKPPGLC